VAEPSNNVLLKGYEALAAGDWSQARDRFREALAEEATAEALAGLGDALWWLGEISEAVTYRQQAYASFRRRPDPARAAVIAMRLCIDHRANFGNPAASGGWLARAQRLVDEFDIEPLRGWLLLTTAYDGSDPVQSEASARQALEQARQAADLDLELCALSQVGASLVEQGRIDEGVAFLDEAMAGSLGGEGGSRDTVVFTSCHMMSSCAACAEFERAVQWLRAADAFTARYGCPFLWAFCRTVYGGVLVATGDWARAERELQSAVQMASSSLPTLRGQSLATLAQLRLSQGRLEEAERLVAGLEDHPGVAPVMAALHLARGNPSLAAVAANRRLAELGVNRLESAPLLELLGEAQILEGAGSAAESTGDGLVELGKRHDSLTILARGHRLRGHAAAVRGEVSAARRDLEAALGTFARLGMPFETARTRALLANTLRHDDREVAVSEARAALATFEDLGAGTDADATAGLLRELGVKAARAGPKGRPTLTKREREVLGLLAEGLSNPEIADRLYVSRRTVEHHVASLLSKLALRNRAEAAAYAIRELGADSARN
jgi:ATP/maltotriose-dependent transcriptional regulator MalT